MLSEVNKQIVYDVLLRMSRGDIKALVAFYIMPDEEFEFAVTFLRDVRKTVRESIEETNPSKQE